MKRKNAPTRTFWARLNRAADVMVYECSGLMFWFTQTDRTWFSRRCDRLRSYAAYYNQTQTHRSLGKDASLPRPVDVTGSKPFLGGLHHQYFRVRFSAGTTVA